jgi:hypothetical protein
MGRPQLEVADVFRKYGEAYREKNPLPRNKRRTMRAIELCRTSELGGHMSRCDTCSRDHPVYNSCRNRHCPKCQFKKTEKWIASRKKEVLPISYFHVVFTLPNSLNPIILMNPKAMYTIFFKSISETLIELGKDPKHLGAKVGAICVLHTWGQTMVFHPHIHCIVTGGGLAADSTRWVSSKKDFFIPVRVLSQLFRGKFLFYMKKYHTEQGLKVNKDSEALLEPLKFSKFMRTVYAKQWIVYSKPPFSGAKSVIDYLGRYTHKVAISNHRIKRLENGHVTFEYRDYADGNTKKDMELNAPEFIRRFLLHV